MSKIDFFKNIENLGNPFNVRVTTKASSNRIKVDKDSNGKLFLRVYVTAAPENGKANAAIIQLFSKIFKKPKSSFEIIQGLSDRNKVIKITQKSINLHLIIL